MKYQAPYGSVDPDAPYVDRNTPGAISGSKVPAPAIEHPQRELAALIAKSGMTPSETALMQVLLAVRSQAMNFRMGAGSANALSITIDPAPDSWTDLIGVPLRVIPAAPNTGPSNLAVTGLAGTRPILSLFGAPLVGGELLGPVQMVYDGTNVWACVVQPGVAANRTYYVNDATGSDSNNGLTAGTAFKTIQKAVDTAASVQWNGFACTVSVANATGYAGVSLRPLSGASSATLTGNVGSPSSVVTGQISNNNTDNWTVQGFKPTVTAAGAHNISCVNGSLTVGPMEWPLNNGGGGSNGGAHIAAGAGGSIILTGTQRIAGGATLAHLYAADGGSIRQAGGASPALNVLGTSGFTSFAVVTTGNIHVAYASITGGANVTAGSRYNATANGTINTDGAGVNHYPGATAGSTATGGQYV